jgi:6,7-dimethyl-8-ribityllumazine synthase
MKKKILLISSSFYKDLEKNLLTGALKEIDKKLFDVNHSSVSGAYEIPQLLNILLKDKKYAFCIALGCIIKGETPHFDIISQSVSDKLLEISIKYNVPVSNGVLNCNNFKHGSLMQLLDHLDQYALQTQRALTIPLVRAMLDNE